MPKISVVVPVFNEEKNIATLYKEILASVKKISPSFEIIFVDDGSTDETFKVLEKLSPIKVIRFRKNFGQSAALDAGIKEAKGDIVITLDGDGQNDPNDFPMLVSELEKGYDVVCGWRYKRKDTFMKKFVSRGAYFLRGFLVRDEIHDAGCSLRAYKKECFEDFNLYGELHRMIPALLRWRGFKIAEVKVNHRPRLFGKTKYNWKRTMKGFLDMIYIWFWRKYYARPLHLFGGMGLVFMMAGAAILGLLFVLRIFYSYSLSDKIWPIAGFVSIMIGIQFLMTGLLASQFVDMSRSKKYFIEKVVSRS